MHYSRWYRTGDPTKARRYSPRAGGLAERVWVKLDKSGRCWEWTGTIDAVSGYGRIQVDGSCRYSHRVVYELLVEPIPEGLQLDHLCRNRACCNPAHLEPVTGKVNVERSERAQRSHCQQGHPYAGENLYVYTDKHGYEHRICRICRDENVRRWRQAS